MIIEEAGVGLNRFGCEKTGCPCIRRNNQAKSIEGLMDIRPLARRNVTSRAERELLPAAKSRWVDAVNMSVACKKEPQFVFTILG